MASEGRRRPPKEMRVSPFAMGRCATMQSYLGFFEFPRYNNLVLAKWMEKPDWTLLLPFCNR